MDPFKTNTKIVERIAVIDREKCRPDKCNHECKIFCPLERSGKEVITITDKAKINECQCIGCGICAKKCPFDAITIINLTHEVGKLVHKFGENGFRLYNLPTIKEKNIVGLIGKNGLGKTTTLKILTGNIIPNLGKINKKISWQEIIQTFRGNEIQQYLEKLSQKQIKISYKIQQVNLLKKVYKGKKVKELLEDVPQEILDDLNLVPLLERKVEHLSGGEIQKIVIAKVLSKNADFYFIDEPTSFLDIRNRLEVAKAIKKHLKEKNTLLVEHDLIILDYLCDYIHILHGYPGAYGVISNIYHTRRGINMYLQGYIKEENIRFREYPIEFSYIKEIKNLKEKVIYIPSIKKSYSNNFKLITEDFEIYKGEVIGILGRNGLGKTTFIKILSGEEKDDEESINISLKISHKPQDPEIEYEGSVEEFIYDNIKINQDLENHLIKPLNINKIKHKNIKTLSGGEMQRLAIVYALSKEADLYLLDEPSAFLDVEERLNLAKIIRKYAEQLKSTIIVIDHDLLFLSSVSDRVMLFDGIPGKEGYAYKPTNFKEAINKFLKNVNITMRRDEETQRPRINKEDSQKDIEMKSKGIYFE